MTFDEFDHCITCSDEARPMRVLDVDEERVLALCAAEDDGCRQTVETALVAPVKAGEVLLVHAGTAIGRESRALV